jgi:type IV pilus assembly protein PilM
MLISNMGILLTGLDFFGLDLGSSSLRVVQTKGGQSRVLVAYGLLDVDPKLTLSDSNADQQKLAQAIKELVSQSRISTSNVAVSIPSQRVFTTVIEVDRISMAEIDKSIRFQADSLIPTPVDESKIDWALLGDSPKNPNKFEVLLTSVTNSYIEQRLDLLESIGLNVIAFEPESIAIARALLAPNTVEPVLMLDMGDMDTNLIITVNDAPRLVRSIPVGTKSIIRAAMQSLGIDEKQATQFVFKFGLSKDKLEGQIYNSIIGTVELLIAEIDKSIKFFNSTYSAVQLNRIIVTGGASTLPELPLVLANKFAVNVEIGNAWRNISFPASKQNDLLAVSSKYTVAAGLAERIE